MPSYDYYRSRGYDAATAAAFAREDEERSAPSAYVPPTPPPAPGESGWPAASGGWPSNPALWFEKPPLPPPLPSHRDTEGSGRFADLDRMAQEERDEKDLAEQRVAAFEREHPPVRPDRVVDLHGRKCSIYLGANALAANRRDARIEELREGGKQ